MISDYLFPPQDEDSFKFVIARAILLTLMLMYTINLFGGIRENMGGLLHLVNLPFHEAGHVIFGLLGNQFLMSLGGTLGQFIMPLVCAGTFYFKQFDMFATIVALWWWAENFVDISPYVNDARAGEIQLIGGNTGKHAPYGFHDWEYLLTETGLLQYDHVLANISYWLGLFLMLLCIVWAGVILWMQYQSCQYSRI